MNPSPFFSTKYSDALLALSDTELGVLTRALLLYSKDGTLPSFSPEERAVAVAFAFVRADIDEERARHAARCQRNRENARKRWNSRKPTAAKAKSPATKPAKSRTARADAAPPLPTVPPAAEPKTSPVNCDALLQYWNRRIAETGSHLPKVSAITPQRRSLLAARLRDHGGSTAVLRDAFERAFRSPWLNGKNPDRWVAGFDWILQPRNFPRVLEGTFDAHAASAPEAPTPPPVPEVSPEERHLREAKAKAEREQRQLQRQRDTLLSAIKAARRNPGGSAASVVARAKADGTLRRLGLETA